MEAQITFLPYAKLEQTFRGMNKAAIAYSLSLWVETPLMILPILLLLYSRRNHFYGGIRQELHGVFPQKEKGILRSLKTS